MPLVLAPLFDRLPRRVMAVNLNGILPDRIAALSVGEIARLEIEADGRPAPLGSLFDVGGHDGHDTHGSVAADGVIECAGDFSRVHSVGAGLAWGEVIVRGNVGRHCGERMTGGRIRIEGDAGDWLAAEMGGGQMHVSGSAGDNAAAALAGSPRGMTGGLVIIRGSAGRLAGSRMRRGIVAIGGDCGEGAGFEMRAGTLVVAGKLGPHAGLGMRRGSIVAFQKPSSIGPGFRRGATWEPPVMSMLLSRLAREGFPGMESLRRAPWGQWHGDMLEGGGGELLTRPC